MRLIDADALLKASRIGKVLYFNDTATDGYTDVLLAVEVERAPTIEVEPVRNGEWVYDEYDIPHCSECGKEPKEISPFCPNCGAKIDL